eukprot:1150399-Pelagomonas_calceolata.AAC.4
MEEVCKSCKHDGPPSGVQRCRLQNSELKMEEGNLWLAETPAHTEFIEVGYKISIGAVEALKPCGVWLLRAVLRVYGSVEDPLLPGGDGHAWIHGGPAAAWWGGACWDCEASWTSICCGVRDRSDERRLARGEGVLQREGLLLPNGLGLEKEQERAVHALKPRPLREGCKAAPLSQVGTKPATPTPLGANPSVLCEKIPDFPGGTIP